MKDKISECVAVTEGNDGNISSGFMDLHIQGYLAGMYVPLNLEDEEQQ